jgi:hypothetical protein
MSSPFVNPYFDPPLSPRAEAQLLRERSETFNRVDDVFKKVSNLRTITVVVFACIATLSVVNLGSSVWANVLTRNTRTTQTARDAALLQDAAGRTLATATTVIEGVVRECESYDALLDASSVSVLYSYNDAQSIFSAKVASVLTVPSAQSLCGFYLLVKTADPVFDVVVSDNSTTLVPKASSNALTYMVLPARGAAAAQALSAAGPAPGVQFKGNSFKGTQTVSSRSVPLISRMNVATADARAARDALVLKAASLWAVSAFLRGELACGANVTKAALPVFVQDASACSFSSAQLNAVAYMASTLDLNAAMYWLDNDPECKVNIESYVSDMQSAIPTSCTDELQIVMNTAGVSPTSADQFLAGEVQTVLASAAAKQASRRKLLKALPCGEVASAFHGDLAIGVGIGCLLSNAKSFLSDVFSGGAGGSGGKTRWKDLYTPFQ